MKLCPNCTFPVREGVEACPNCSFSFANGAAIDLEDEEVYRAVVAGSALKSAFNLEKIRRWVLVIGITFLVMLVVLVVFMILVIFFL